MTTLKEVQEGAKDYFTLVEIENKEIVIVEPITGGDFVFRSHTIEAQGRKGKAEYFDIAVWVDGQGTKDIGITYTGLASMIRAIGKNPVQYAKLLYEGTKGSGKNIKYLWTYKGQSAPPAPPQATLIPPTSTLTSPDQNQKDPRHEDFLNLLRQETQWMTIDDVMLDKIALHAFKDTGLARFAIQVLKNGGKIANPDGKGWVVT